MSSTSSSLLVLLFLAVYACTARPIGNDENEPGTSIHFSIKNGEKLSLGGIHVTSNPVSPKTPKESELAKIHSPLVENVKVNDETQSTFAERPLPKNVVKGDDHHERSRVEADAVKTESTATVYWNSADEFLGQEDEPRYDVDYAPPKTHPPHHN